MVYKYTLQKNIHITMMVEMRYIKIFLYDIHSCDSV